MSPLSSRLPHRKGCNLTGCDKVVLKNSMGGSRFVNMTDNDLQKFPKLLSPMISKISNEISKKEEKRGLFPLRWTRTQEPEAAPDDQGWDDEEFDDDYESPYSEEGSAGDYESPSEDPDACEYEPPPTEQQLPHPLCPPPPIGDGEYIDKREPQPACRGPPPTLCPRPPAAGLPAPPRPDGDADAVKTRKCFSEKLQSEVCAFVIVCLQAADSRRDASPSARRAPGSLPPAPPQIFREHKPGRDSGSNPSPVRGSGALDRVAQPRRPPADGSRPVLAPPFSSSVSRSNSSARTPPSRFEGRREQTSEEPPKHNTFPFLPPRPGIPGPPGRPGDSLPPSVASAGSLPPKLQPALMMEPRGSFSSPDRQPRPPPRPVQGLDPCWYVGRVTRGQAENRLKKVCKDGAYLVRDSTRQQENQPFTLMVLYQNKVYNIQVRQQDQLFQLGTGLKAQESFPSVADMVRFYSSCPLLLIDAKNRRTGPQNQNQNQNQCLLAVPAGAQTWS
ncbi:LOW QUALITY PROTEIN: lymphocyte cytosolic protein 2a [Menidia menidia]